MSSGHLDCTGISCACANRLYQADGRLVFSLARDLLHALNYKRVWRGGREGLAEVISIHEALTTVQNPCHGSHLGASIVSRSSCYENKLMTSARPSLPPRHTRL